MKFFMDSESYGNMEPPRSSVCEIKQPTWQEIAIVLQTKREATDWWAVFWSTGAGPAGRDRQAQADERAWDRR